MRKIPVEVWVILGALLFVGGGTAVYTMTRGLRNNNPGNIRKSGDKWAGLAAEQPDTAFFTFVSPEYGIRAMARILLNYSANYGLNTVRGIINRWAPPTENDTSAYVAHVASKLGVSPDTPINVRTALPVLVPAIIKHENGLNPYSDATILKGIQLALAA